MGAQLLTTQLNLIKFLKHNAPESRVFSGRDPEATMLSRRSENSGFFSSVLSAISAGKISQKLDKELQHRKTYLAYAADDLVWLRGAVQESPYLKPCLWGWMDAVLKGLEELRFGASVCQQSAKCSVQPCLARRTRREIMAVLAPSTRDHMR